MGADALLKIPPENFFWDAQTRVVESGKNFMTKPWFETE